MLAKIQIFLLLKKEHDSSLTKTCMKQAPLCDVKEMKITKRGNPFMLDFIPEVCFHVA